MGGDTENILARLVRIGTVTAVNRKNRTARVKFQDTGETSAFLYVLQHNGAALNIMPDGEHNHVIHDTYKGGGSSEDFPDHDHRGSALGYWMPAINSNVLVLYLPVYDSDGFILGVI